MLSCPLGEEVLAYLARYVFRIAITNSRLERLEDGQVTFRYRDNRSGEMRRCTLPVAEFLSRFTLHILPRGFTKVRYYGLYSSSRAGDLDTAWAQLASPPRKSIAATAATRAQAVALPAAGPDPPRCRACGIGFLLVVETIPRQRSREPP